MKLLRVLLCFPWWVFPLSSVAVPPGFVTTRGLNFVRYDKKYTFIGANLWYGMHLGTNNRARLVHELDRLQRLGVKNLRILAAAEGPDSEPWRIVPAVQTAPGLVDEKLLRGLDFLFHEMRRRDMTAVVVLGNYWYWSGGFAQYLRWAGKGDIPYPDFDEEGRGGIGQTWTSWWKWSRYNLYTADFYSTPAAMEYYEKYIRKIITRINHINNIPYVKDRVILSWQLANEPAGFMAAGKYDAWIANTARLIKSLDAHHLVSIGAMGEVFAMSGVEHLKNNSHPEIDYATVHVWVQNAAVYDPKNPEKTYPRALSKMHELLDTHREYARLLNKPLVFEEFGLSRDANSLKPTSPVAVRDHYYREVFQAVIASQSSATPVAGVNFWAWAGEGLPVQARWQPGDPFTGDPPHEAQGWYGVYAADKSTLTVITQSAVALQAASK